MATQHLVQAQPLQVNLSAYALALSSHHLFEMASNYDAAKNAKIIRVYVLCVSLELGMKAAVLSKDCSAATKGTLKEIGHDLAELHEEFRKRWGSDPFDAADAAVMTTVTPLFSKKGLEYFTGPMLQAVAEGHKGIPEVEEMVAAGAKLQALLTANKHFIEA